MRIVICTPCMSGDVNLAFAISLSSTLKAIQRTEVLFLTNIGSSILHMARNTLVAQAMSLGADQIVFIDDDVSWPTAAFERLCTATGTIVGGVYQKKMFHPSGTPEMALSALPEGLVPNKHGLCEVDGAATGFLRIDRQVFEDMKPYVQKLQDDRLNEAENAELYEYFAFGKQIRNNFTYAHGEDFYFCKKAREAGHKTYIDPNIHLGHHLRGFKFDAKLKTVELL